jgi:uncharacterized protein YdgA (DUF945 family)
VRQKHVLDCRNIDVFLCQRIEQQRHAVIDPGVDEGSAAILYDEVARVGQGARVIRVYRRYAVFEFGDVGCLLQCGHKFSAGSGRARYGSDTQHRMPAPFWLAVLACARTEWLGGNDVNRWVVVILIALALIVFVSPGIVGRLAERTVEENLDFAARESDEIIVTTESFVRGWFTSEGRHRIALRDGPIRALFEDETGGEIPSLIVETHVDHGLVPVTSVSRDSGSLMPALASTVSTLKVAASDGEIFEVPGKIYSEVGLTGETKSRFLLEAGSRNVDDLVMEWQGADVTIRTNPSAGSVAYQGEVLPVSFLGESGGVKVGNIAIDGTQQMTPFGFRIGSARLEMLSVTVASTGDREFSFARFRIDADSALDGDRVNGGARTLVSGVPIPSLGDMDIVVDTDFSGLDARSLQQIIEAVQDAQRSTDPQDALANLYPAIEADIQRALTSGLELRFDQIDVTLPNSALTTKLRFELPRSDAAVDFSWPALLLALNASADVHIPAEIFELAKMANPEAEMLFAMGFLKKVDDYYEMRAEYSKGLITVNGAPMPIPLQGN